MPIRASTTLSLGASAARAYESADRPAREPSDVFRNERRLTEAMASSWKETGPLRDGGCRAFGNHRTGYRQLPFRAKEIMRSVAPARFPRTAAVTRVSWRFGRVGRWEGRLACWL